MDGIILLLLIAAFALSQLFIGGIDRLMEK